MIAICLAAAIADHATASQTTVSAIQPRSDPAVIEHSESFPQTETVLRSIISELQQGRPDYSRMEPMIQMFIQQQLPNSSKLLQKFGALQKVEFLETRDGTDMFRVDFLNGPTTWSIRLSNSGKIAELTLRPYRGGD
jgi:hypothetical protein